MVRVLRSLAVAVLLVQLSHVARAQSASTAPATPAPVAPTAVAPAAVAPVEKLTGLSAWERLKGNTIDGKSAGQSIAEYFDAGGGVKYVDKDGLSTGTWSIDKNKVCSDFPDEDDRTCLSFEVMGDTGTAVDDDGQTIRFTILPGNSKGL